MIEAWTAPDVRTAEAPLLERGVPLMERAAFALATITARDLAHRRSVVGTDGERQDGPVVGARALLLVGPGNNGGDALFAGAHLARRGVAVRAVCTTERVHEAGLAAFRAAGGRVDALGTDGPGPVDGPGPLDEHGRVVAYALAADVVLDGLVGIGSRGALRGPARALVESLVEGLEHVGRRPWVVAVDVPSGIGVDDGTVPGPVLPADRTVTFGVAKPGLLLPPATHLAGRGAVVDVGLDASGVLDRVPAAVRRLEVADVARLWPVPGPRDHKYTRGVVGVVAGTPTFPGAAVLVATAAVRTGAGMVRAHGPDDVSRPVLAARPEVVPAEGRVQAWALGSGVPGADEAGLGDGDREQQDHLRAVLAVAAEAVGGKAVGGEEAGGEAVGAGASGGREPAERTTQVPLVVDAGALTFLPGRLPPWVVLTPHAGELATLLGSRGEDVSRAGVEAEPLRWARRAHELLGATVLLKGSVTVVVGPGVVLAQADAPPWLATAGAGDVLTGILGTLLAAHSERVVAEPALAAELAAAAALVHGLAADRANPGGPVAALGVADAVPRVVAELLAAGDPSAR